MKAEKVEPKKIEQYEIEGWVSTLLSAEEIKNDSEKMALIKPFLEKKQKAIKSLADLKSVANEKIKAAQESDEEESED